MCGLQDNTLLMEYWKLEVEYVEELPNVNLHHSSSLLCLSFLHAQNEFMDKYVACEMLKYYR